MMPDKDISAPIHAIARLRPGTDGDGISTLVTFYGCPLRCKYCLNARTLGAIPQGCQMTPEEVYERVRIDDLYFRVTGGGVTFGGGEPCLQSEFIRRFADLNRHSWKIRVESSLNVPAENVRALMPIVDQWIVDVKSWNAFTYLAYTGRDNTNVKGNLAMFALEDMQDKVLIRLPLITSFNDEDDRQNSMGYLREMGFSNFDLFTYKTPKQ